VKNLAQADRQALLDEVHSMLAPANPVAPAAFEGEEHDWIRPVQAEKNRGRWRVLAPALSGLAVTAVVAGLALAGGARPNSGGGSGPLGGLPRFYLTMNGLPPKETVIVHSTMTGQVLTSVHIPNPAGGLAVIAAARSDRVFYVATSGMRPGSSELTTVILRLSLSGSGRSAKLTRLPIYLRNPEEPGSAVYPDDIAVSPDGRELAALVQYGNEPGLRPASEIMLAPLRPGGRYTIWRAARGDFAFGWDTAWVSDTGLAFLWQDKFKGTEADYTARTAERLLNTRSSNRNLLSSAVLARGGGELGFIQSAYAAPDGGPIIAALARDVPATGPVGTALVRLVALSPATGKITKVFASRLFRYRNANARFNDDLYYAVFGLDASGKDALVFGPQFGMISRGRFTRLPAGPGLVTGAAW
jgi:hypothetical protein